MTAHSVFRCVQSLMLGMFLIFAHTPAARAHPDVWVTVAYQLTFSQTAMTEAEVVWTYDVFYSDRVISQYDVDGDGTFSDAEKSRLQAAIFDPLATEGYHVLVYLDTTAQQMRLARFDPAIKDGRLSLTFTLVPEVPLNVRQGTIALATFDDTVFDFALEEEDFLTVGGAFDPTCRFRVQTGEGPLDGVPQTILLICPA